MIPRIRGPLFLSLVVLYGLGCSNSSSSGGSGCNSTPTDQVCDIDTTATLCPGLITLDCHAGAKPEAKTQCIEALKEGDESIYCCTNKALPLGDGGGGGG